MIPQTTQLPRWSLAAVAGLLMLAQSESTPAGILTFTDPQLEALEQLRSASSVPVEVRFVQGFPRTLTFRLEAPGATSVEAAQYVLDQYRELFRQGEARTGGGPQSAQPSEVHVRSVFPLGGSEVVAFHQTLGGLPVLAANLMIFVDTTVSPLQVHMATGALLHSQFLDVVPAITPEQAEALARAALPGTQGDTATRVGDVRLLVNDPALAGESPDPRVVWAVTLAAQHPAQFLVDAHSGEIILQGNFGPASEGLDDYDLYLQDANGSNILDTQCFNPTTIDDYIGDEDGVISEYLNDTEAVSLWWHLRRTYEFYHDTYSRHSYDGDGEEIEAYVYSNTPGGARFVNSCGFEFAPGSVGFDTAVHEFTHAITFLSSQLVYSDQPGALDESFADVMGAVADDADWLLGEDQTGGGGAIRSLADPLNGSCGPPTAPYACGQPDRMSLYCDSDEDCGFSDDNNGVHTNSGIPNKAHYLMAVGGEFNGETVPAMGRAKMGRLAYTVLQLLPSHASFLDARNTGIAVAQTFVAVGLFQFTANDVCSVRNAWAAVEIGSGDVDCDGVENDADDSDMDGIPDADDNCPLDGNPVQVDSDNDGLGDICDEDADGDSCPNFKDNCPGFSAPCTGVFLGVPDTDNDGLGDACDSDDDGDGVADDVDNCPWDPNPGQEDGNSNGQGDACDPDLDGDGFYTELDNCTFVFNPAQEDSDGDGLGDACDRCPGTADNTNAYTTGFPELGVDPSPLQPDSDGDGTPDACDEFAFGDLKLLIEGLLYNPTRTLRPDRSGRAVGVQGPTGASFRIPLEVCTANDGAAYGLGLRLDVVVYDLPESMGLWISDQNGTRIAKLSPPIEGERGMRFKPDCRNRYELQGILDQTYEQPQSFTVYLVPGPYQEDYPWTTPGSGDPPPQPIPDGDGDDLPDEVDNCPDVYNPEQTDSDHDGSGDECDLCLGDDTSGDQDEDGLCASHDCDDTTPDPTPIACNELFLDGFESSP